MASAGHVLICWTGSHLQAQAGCGACLVHVGSGEHVQALCWELWRLWIM